MRKTERKRNLTSKTENKAKSKIKKMKPKMKTLNRSGKFSLLSPLFFASILTLFATFNSTAEKINFRADYMTGRNGSKSDTTKLIGNAFVQTETMEIKADTITMSGDNFRYITAEGSVDGLNTESEMTFTCGKMKYDRTTKIAYLEDSVKMVDKKNEVTADAQIIEYNQKTEVALMQIGVKILQKDNTCTGAHAIYRKKEQTLDLSGNPKITQGEDTFRAQEISLNMDTNEITLDGRVSGSVTDTKKKDEDTDADSEE